MSTTAFKEGPRPRLIHCIPIGDFYLHEGKETCWCHPIRDQNDPMTVIHNAKDCREAKERNGISTGKGWVNIAEY
jgi:hypothetical protein